MSTGPLKARIWAFGVLVSLLMTAHSDAAGRRPYGGQVTVAVRAYDALDDPHRVATADQRVLASLTHCTLFASRLGRGEVPVLAIDRGQWEQRELTLSLRRGLRFHNGEAIEARDVVASLERIASLDDALMAPALRRLSVSALGTHRVRIKGPRGMKASTLRALLARADVAILADGRPGLGHGCGPFVPGQGEMERTLTAFVGHPLGRPWLDRVRLRRMSDKDEVSGLVFGDVDVSALASPRFKRTGGVRVRRGVAPSTVVGVVGPRLRGPSARAVRRRLAEISAAASWVRHVYGKAEVAVQPWPSALGPSMSLAGTETRSVRHAGELVIAYPRGAAGLEALAWALRDAVQRSGLVAQTVRVKAVAQLTLSETLTHASGTPAWDIALGEMTWSASDVVQLATEYFQRFVRRGAAPGLSKRQASKWLAEAAGAVHYVPILHLQRGLHWRAGLYPELRGDGGLDLGNSWRP